MKQFLKKICLKMKYRNKHVYFAKGSVIGFNSVFEGYNKIGKDSVFSGKMGYGSYIGARASLSGKIGKFCCIAHGVTLVTGFHPVDCVSIHPAFFSTRKQCGMTFTEKQLFTETRTAEKDYSIVIGNDVWIGQNALLMSGIHIGDGAVIAAGAVVTKDVAPYTIVGGVPAKEIRRRFDDETADQIERIAWWNWSEDQLQTAALWFQNPKEFICRYDKSAIEEKQ